MKLQFQGGSCRQSLSRSLLERSKSNKDHKLCCSNFLAVFQASRYSSICSDKLFELILPDSDRHSTHFSILKINQLQLNDYNRNYLCFHSSVVMNPLVCIFISLTPKLVLKVMAVFDKQTNVMSYKLTNLSQYKPV